MAEEELSFEAMGSRVRLLIGAPRPGRPEPALAAEAARRFVERFDESLSRFRGDSELSRLNADPRRRVPASPLMRAAVRAGLHAARLSGGLVDPTLAREVHAAGYDRSLAGVPAASLAEALASAPPRRPASPAPAARWRAFELDERSGAVVRPPGIAFDTGGTGKGLAADLLAEALRGYRRFVVDCGGDIRLGGPDALVRPYEVFVEHPLSGRRTHALLLSTGGVATSGLNVRLWRRDDGTFGHHLIDPATGSPAWTGLVGATALAETAVEAETLAKAALLSGPVRGRDVLAERGGALVHDDGRVEPVGPLSIRELPPGPRPLERAGSLA